MKIFFTADPHFFHNNIIQYCNRPFKDRDEMNEALIANWNSVVTDNDQIYILGDFSFTGTEGTEKVLVRLNGKKFLIRGNHDHEKVISKVAQYFVWIKDVYMLTVQDQNPYAPEQAMSVYPNKNQMIWLSHYAHKVWPQQHYGVWHLFGHSHGLNPDDPKTMSMDVGVDCTNYAPISYEDIKKKMALKTWKPPFKRESY